MRARVIQAFRGWHAPVEALVATTAEVMRTAIYDVPTLPTWHVGRVMLLGDAAHAMSPAGGQGASLALEDAMIVGQRSRREAIGREVYRRPNLSCGLGPSDGQSRRPKTTYVNSRSSGGFGQWLRDRLFPLFVPFIGS